MRLRPTVFDRSVVHAVHVHTRAHPRYWLVAGKGPTADHVGEVDRDLYHVLTLNHACRVVTPTVAHFVDADALEECKDRLLGLDCYVCLPWHPHVGFKSGGRCLDEYPWAAGFGDRLLSYNSTTTPTGLPKNRRLHTVRLRYFSAVAAFNILVMAGVRTIHSVGVDGGTGYAGAFDRKTRLANGRKTFDDQFGEINRTVRESGATWTRLEFPGGARPGSESGF